MHPTFKIVEERKSCATLTSGWCEDKEKTNDHIKKKLIIMKANVKIKRLRKRRGKIILRAIVNELNQSSRNRNTVLYFFFPYGDGDFPLPSFPTSKLYYQHFCIHLHKFKKSNSFQI